MKYLITAILTNLLIMSCNNSKNILNDFNLHSYYIAIDIVYTGESIPIVINNAYLYYLLMNDALSKKEYIELMKRTLDSGGIFHVRSGDLYIELLKHRVELNYENSEKFVNKYIDKYINDFFDENKVLKVQLSEEERKYLIYLLFKNNIYLKDDDETGYLYIPR
jgi:hypothetical protein